MIILMALAVGKSVVRCGPITMHTKTAIYIAESLSKVVIVNHHGCLIMLKHHSKWFVTAFRHYVTGTFHYRRMS